MYRHLLMKIADNDEKAFAEFHVTSCHRLTKICYNRKVPEDEVPDLLQEIYTRVWEIRPNLKAIKNCSDYVIRIACNLITDYNKKRAKQQKTLIIDSNLVENCGQVLLPNACSYHHTEEMALYLIRALPCKQQQVMLLTRQGLSRKEIAAQMKITISCVDRHLQLGKKTLQTSIRAYIERH